MAVNGWLVPRGMLGFCGLSAIDTSAAAFTTNVAGALTVPELTPIVVVPVLIVLASPAVPAVLLMVATLAAVELQCPLAVRSCVVPSVNAPVAVNCCGLPRATVASGGLIAIDTRAAAVTVSMVELLMVPELAVTVAVPVPMLCASTALLIVAVETVSDDQVAVLVRSCVLPSVNVPVTVNGCVVPSAMEGFAGVIARDTSTAVVTVRVVEPVTDPKVAVMVALPCPRLLATPWLAESLLIDATAEASELHCDVPVMFCVLPSL